VGRISAKAWLLAGASGVLHALLFLSPGFSVLSWVALAPLLVALTLPSRPGAASPTALVSPGVSPGQGFLLAWAAGAVSLAGSCSWVFHVMHSYGGLSGPVSAGIMALFCLYYSLFHGLFGALFVLAWRLPRLTGARALMLAPPLWVACELWRTRVQGFPWDLLGTAAVDNLPLAQVATVTGVYGLSFIIVLVNAAFAAALLLPASGRRAVLAVSLAGVAALESGRLADPPPYASTHTAVLLQHNISVSESRWTAESFDRTLKEISALSAATAARSAGKGSPKLIAWPESPAPFYESDPTFRRHVSLLAMATGAHVLAGDIALQPSPRPGRRQQALNSASMIAPDGSWLARYDKIHLVPFGEYVPFEELLFFAGTLTREAGDFGRGRERTLLPLGEHRVAVFICYEAVFPEEVREFALGGAQVFLNISNDSWLGDSGGPAQHLNMARMRAIENRRWLLRPTNSGITASIDPYGRVVARAPRDQRVALEAPYGFITETMFYTRHGDVFAVGCAIIALAALLLLLRRRQA